MVKSSASCNLYSHPNKLLHDHLIGVKRFTEFFLKSKPDPIRQTFQEVCKITALCHDIGKATRFFQDYLFAEPEHKEHLKSLPETRHSLLSAICSYYITKISVSDPTLWLFAFVSVRRHHDNLIDMYDESCNFNDDDLQLIKIQIKHIDRDKFDTLTTQLKSAGLPFSFTLDDLSNWADNFEKELKTIRKILRKYKGTLKTYISCNLIYSLLLDADKSDVVIGDTKVFETDDSLDGSLIDRYKTNRRFSPSPINSLREKAYTETIQAIQRIKDKRIFSLNLPTGLGKTLSSLSFALKLRSKLGADYKIIYALPFLSIIDQNSQTFEEVLEANNIKPLSNIFLKHHHLSDLYYKTNNHELDPDEARIMIEGWNAQVIFTTFAQLFYTLLSNRNRTLRKFHKLSRSIIILDEVQAIPVKYWSVVRELLCSIAKLFDSFIIIVTATEPLIFEDTLSLIDKTSYYKKLNRVILNVHTSKFHSISELADGFALAENKTYLFIFNTINSAKDFYNLLKDKISQDEITFLSSHITPKERLMRIRDIRDKRFRIAISTQLVEAGVDIDFDIVIRDIAPFDCINQSAGRCNRNALSQGQIHIISLFDENGRSYASYIYDTVLLDITNDILTRYQTISEDQFPQVIEHYFKECIKRKSTTQSDELLDAIKSLRYDSVDLQKTTISSFKLIESYPQRDVFIELDDDAKELWKRYTSLIKIKDIFERKKDFDSFKAKFYQYIISVPFTAQNLPIMYGELGYVKNEILRDYYDTDTGYILKDTRSVIIG